MAIRRGGETISQRQFDWHKRYHHRLLAHPGYQGLSFEQRGIYNTLYDLAAVANDDGAIRISGGDRFTKRKLTEFLALQAARGKPIGEFMAWAKSAVDSLLASELVRVDGNGTVWVVNYADEQAAISPAGLRKRAQREREAGRDDDAGGGAAVSGGAPRPGVGPAPLTVSADGFDGDSFDAGSDGVREVGQSRDSHDQNQNQRRGTYVPQRSESEEDARRDSGADGRNRFDAAALSGAGPTPGRGAPPEGDIYALPIIDAACRVMKQHGARSVNLARKQVRELGEAVVWNVIGEVHQAWKDGVVRARDRETGQLTGGPLFSDICNRYRARAAIAAMGQSVQDAGRRGPIGFGG